MEDFPSSPRMAGLASLDDVGDKAPAKSPIEVAIRYGGTAIRGLLVALTLIVVAPTSAQAQSRPPAPLSNMLASPGHPGWSVDSRTGCWVWNDTPEANDTVTWSGGCAPDGRSAGHGVIEWRSDDKVSRYDGEVREGKRNGHGVADTVGAHYDGEWRDDRANGHGVIIWANGDRYDGEFRDGQPNGHGVGLGTDGTRYEGELANGKPNGHGVSTWTNGDRYDGNWQDGRPAGNGDASIKGESYRGAWTAGCYRDGDRKAAITQPPSECP
jgi:hypothetical protein